MKHLAAEKKDDDKKLKDEKKTNTTEDAIVGLERQIEDIQNAGDTDDQSLKLTRQKQITDLKGRIITLKQGMPKKEGSSMRKLIESSAKRLERAAPQGNIMSVVKQVFGFTGRPTVSSKAKAIVVPLDPDRVTPGKLQAFRTVMLDRGWTVGNSTARYKDSMGVPAYQIQLISPDNYPDDSGFNTVTINSDLGVAVFSVFEELVSI